MRAILRPFALAVVVVFAAVPLARLACQWVCAAPAVSSASVGAAAAAHHHAGHGSPAHADMPAAPTDGTTAVHASASRCDHAVTVDPAVARSTAKDLVALTSSMTHVVVAPMPVLGARLGSYAIHSPPGGRSAPLSLRI